MIGDRRTKDKSEINISLEDRKKGHRGKLKRIRTKDKKIDNGKCKNERMDKFQAKIEKKEKKIEKYKRTGIWKNGPRMSGVRKMYL